VPDLGGPLLAKKGKASAAPPIDLGAINHEVDPRKSAPEPIVPMTPDEIEALLGEVPEAADFGIAPAHRPLAGRHVLVTAGPTWEAIDPVRYIANRSSGKQGFAIAAAAAALGAKVTLVAGPVSLKTPAGVKRIDVESALQMAEAVKRALPADVAVMVAAVADWRPKEYRGEKIKKRGDAPPALMLTENPDILTNLASGSKRPALVIGFAAETENVIENAKSKRKRKVADWIVANDVSGDVMGGDRNRVHIVSGEWVETLDEMPKSAVAMALAERIAAVFHAEAAE
jgi:phosphopantothenoylcysteine decarboxylase/phosphopantothenate--cysteine ligase